MKITQLALALGALALSGAAAAELSANIGVTSNYVWRGVSQTGNDAAVSGGIDYGHDSGFYAGTWASNVDFGDGDEGAEVDFYGGFGNEIGDSGFSYDVNAIYYYYPNFDDSDFAEIGGSLGWKWFNVGLSYTVWSQVNKTKGNDTFIDGDMYYYLNGSYEVAPTWTLGGTIGYYDFKEDGRDGIDTSYLHGQIDVTKGAGDFGDFTLSVSNAEKESGDDDVLVFVSWAKTFD